MSNTAVLKKYKGAIGFATLIAIYVALYQLGPVIGPLISPKPAHYRPLSYYLAPYALVLGLITFSSYIFSAGIHFSKANVISTFKLLFYGAVAALTIQAALLLSSLPTLGINPIPDQYFNVLYWFMLPIGITLLEETFFRGYLYDLLRWLGARAVTIALITSIIFAVLHPPVRGDWLITVVAFSSSIVMTLARAYYKTLAWPIAFHFAWDWSDALTHGQKNVSGLEAGLFAINLSGFMQTLIIVSAHVLISIYLLVRLQQRMRFEKLSTLAK